NGSTTRGSEERPSEPSACSPWRCRCSLPRCSRRRSRAVEVVISADPATLVCMTQATTLGELRASGYPDRTVKQELRANLLDRLELGQELFPGILGFDDTVLPGLERGILAGHDLILLGERGQAKTRLVRAIVNFLDDSLPVIVAAKINDHPFRPICARCVALIADDGDAVPIHWIAREDRYAEKLA